jgi:hypothetical protein
VVSSAVGRKEASLSYAIFSVFFVALSASMALWLDVRFRGLTPSDLRAGGLRLVAAFVVAQLAVPLAGWAVSPLPPSVEPWTLVGVGFAAMVFLMLAVVWMLRLAHGLLGGMLR